MSEAPERIWTQPDMKGFCITGVWPRHPKEQRNMTEYVRADALAAAQEENERLREALEYGKDLIEGEAVGAEWKQKCLRFIRKAAAALGKEG